VTKKTKQVTGKRYRASTHINTDPHTNPGDEFDPSLVSEETLSIFIALGLVTEEDAAATGEDNGKESIT
jgi:hypothetical protein